MRREQETVGREQVSAGLGRSDHHPIDRDQEVERGYDKQPVGYGAGGCPPGLRRKNAQCLPPGQHKKLFDVGQRVPTGYKGLMRYNALPPELRRQYGGALDPRAHYIYDPQYLYRVDPATMVVREVLRGLLGS